MQPSSDEAGLKRRNAVGILIAVPELKRLNVAAPLSLATSCSACVWDCPTTPRFMHEDIATDVVHAAENIADRLPQPHTALEGVGPVH